jgi:Domain of unknown function (DUF2703)
MFITACCFLALANSNPQASTAEPRPLEIEFLYLDLTECTRCVDTGTRLEQALALLAPVLTETGWEARLKKTHVTTEEQARALCFSSSPTVRIDGRDIQLESRESGCGDCGKLCKDSSVTCREWQFQGKWFTSPPKGIFVEAILNAMARTPREALPAAGPFELPDNLRRFFANRKAGAGSRTGCCSESAAKTEHGGCCESKPSGKAAEGCCQGDAAAKAPACTLGAESREARKGLLKQIVASAVERREIDDGLSFRFQAEPGIVSRLAGVIDRERDCCQFLAFRLRVEENGGPVWLDVTGSAAAKKSLQELFGGK